MRLKKACRSRASPSLGRAGAGHPVLEDSASPRTRRASRARTIYSSDAPDVRRSCCSYLSDAPGVSRSYSSSAPGVRRLHLSSDVSRVPRLSFSLDLGRPAQETPAGYSLAPLRWPVLLGGRLSRPSSSASCASGLVPTK